MYNICVHLIDVNLRLLTKVIKHNFINLYEDKCDQGLFGLMAIK